jgi:hypothetical protein
LNEECTNSKLETGDHIKHIYYTVLDTATFCALLSLLVIDLTETRKVIWYGRGLVQLPRLSLPCSPFIITTLHLSIFVNIIYITYWSEKISTFSHALRYFEVRYISAYSWKIWLWPHITILHIPKQRTVIFCFLFLLILRRYIHFPQILHPIKKHLASFQGWCKSINISILYYSLCQN